METSSRRHMMLIRAQRVTTFQPPLSQKIKGEDRNVLVSPLLITFSALCDLLCNYSIFIRLQVHICSGVLATVDHMGLSLRIALVPYSSVSLSKTAAGPLAVPGGAASLEVCQNLLF